MSRMRLLMTSALAGLSIALLTALPARGELRLQLPLARANLNGGLARTSAPLVLPGTVAIRRAQLVLGYANALAVDPTGSSLRVGINGTPVAELPLIAAQDMVSAEIDLPPALLAAGPNELSFQVEQRHRVGCERAAFNELWTRLDATGSIMKLDLVPRDSPLTLRDLDLLLASSLYNGEALLVAGRRAFDDAAFLSWGGLAAEAVALRRGQRHLEVRAAQLALPGIAPISGPAPSVAWDQLSGQNVVVVGTLAEIAPLLPGVLPSGADHGAIAIRPLPADPAHFGIIVTGRTDAQVEDALRWFGSLAREWPSAPIAALGPGTLVQPAAAAVPAIAGGHAVTLAELGYATEELPLSFTETLEVALHLPDDYYAGDGQRIELGLNFAYGAGLAPTSALVVRVNDAPWNMVRLDRQAGDIVDEARVELPMGLFRPGRNTIAFQPVLHPATQDLCGAAGAQPMFTLFDDSRIEIPDFARLARQPDLRLFAATGFPHSAPGEGTALVVTGPTPAALAAAWTLRGKLAQRRGATLPDIVTATQIKPTDRHLLVIGSLDALPRELVAASPLPLGQARTGTASTLPDAAGSSGIQTGRARELWQGRLDAVAEQAEHGRFAEMTAWLVSVARAVPQEPQRPAPSVEQLWAAEERPDAGSMIAFRSPFATNRTATVITASSDAQLANAVTRLVDDRIWRQLDGDVAVWTAIAEPVLSRRISPPYVVEPVDTSIGHLSLLARTFLAGHAGYWLAVVFPLIGGLSLVTGILLRRRRSA
jgi:hypothetical protein